MSTWEPTLGASDEWYTPAFVFDALGETFDLDVAAPPQGGPHVPTDRWIYADSLETEWSELSFWEVKGERAYPIPENSVPAALGYCPQPLIFSAPVKLVRAGWPLGAENVSVWGRGRSKGGCDVLKEPLLRGAYDASANALLISKISHPKPPPATASLPAAETATEKFPEIECEGCGRSSPTMLSDLRKLTWRVKPGENGSANSLELITLVDDKGSCLQPSIGSRDTGLKCKTCSKKDALTADQAAPSIRTISSHCPILHVPALFEEISYPPASDATWLRDHGIPLDGSVTRTLSHASKRGSLVIGLWGKPFLWNNPPFGGRNGLVPWLDKFFGHGHGIALTPDRTSAPWWQNANRLADATLFIAGKVKFERPDGSIGKSPGTGTTLFADGQRAVDALHRAERAGLGVVMRRAAT